jgi:hypothetical protein
VPRSFALGVFTGAVVVAAPLAALTIAPASPKSAKAGAANLAASQAPLPYTAAAHDAPTDLPHIIARGVSTSVATAVAAIDPVVLQGSEPDYRVEAPSGAMVESRNGTVVTRSPTGATVTLYPVDAKGRRKMVSRAPSGASVVTYVDADDVRVANMRPDRQRRHDGALDRIIEMKAVGVTPEYIAAMRTAVPQLEKLEFGDFTSMRAVGVTPEYARALIAAGFPSITADELVEARAVGVTGDYVRAMRSTGLRGDIDDFVQLRAVGVDPGFAGRVKASGIKVLDVDDLVELRALGVARPPAPPRTPAPARTPDPDSDPSG